MGAVVGGRGICGTRGESTQRNLGHPWMLEVLGGRGPGGDWGDPGG